MSENITSDLIKNIVSTDSGQVDQNILGDAPELDRSLLQDIEPPKSVLLLILKIFFVMILVASAGSLIFFSSQLSGTFDFVTGQFGLPNVSKELTSTNTEIIGLQTDINVNRVLKIKGNIDKFSYIGDEYLQNYDTANSPTSSDIEKKEALGTLIKVKGEIKAAFLAARENLAKNLAAPLIDINFEDNDQLVALYQDKLKAALNDKANTLANSTDEKVKKDYRNYVQAVKLVGNNQLKDLFIQTDFDKLNDKALYDFIKKADGLIVNDLSTIQEIKSKRVKWSDIMNELALRTMAVDSHYNEDFYASLGGIRYTSYEFDTQNRKISIVGETKKFDTTNFTMIADLIDKLNESELFANAEMRSLNKSGSLTDGYIAQLKMVFDLKKDGAVSPNKK